MLRLKTGKGNRSKGLAPISERLPASGASNYLDRANADFILGHGRQCNTVQMVDGCTLDALPRADLAPVTIQVSNPKLGRDKSRCLAEDDLHKFTVHNAMILSVGHYRQEDPRQNHSASNSGSGRLRSSIILQFEVLLPSLRILLSPRRRLHPTHSNPLLAPRLDA
jgi:hypothetical protein